MRYSPGDLFSVEGVGFSGQLYVRKYRYELMALALVLVIGLAYGYNLTGWRLDDDEGTYLYGAWRISLGEVIYRDFLINALPPFQYSGGFLIRCFGPDLAILRMFSIALTLLAGALGYALVRRQGRGRLALLVLFLYLIYPEVYHKGRLYRPEAYMMPLLMAGLLLFVEWHRRGHRLSLVASGVVLGLATATREFAALTVLGCGWFLLAQWLGDPARRGYWWRALWTFIASYLLTLSLVALIVYGLIPEIANASELGLYLRSGGSRFSWRKVLPRAGDFLWGYVQAYPAVALGALGWAIWAYRRDEQVRIWSWQLPTALIYPLLSVNPPPRYLLYLLPALVLLLAGGIEHLLRRKWVAWAGIALLALTVIPALQEDWATAQLRDTDTEAVVAYIHQQCRPGEVLLGDYPGLNFLAQRPSTPMGPALSAITTEREKLSGHELIEELERYQVKLVALDISGYSHHTKLLPDFDVFLSHIGQGYIRLDEVPWDKYRLVFYRRRPEVDPARIPHPTQLRLGEGIGLLGYELEQPKVMSGGTIHLTLYWQAEAPVAEDYTVFVHLLDGSGTLRSQADSMPWHNAFHTSRWPKGMIIPDDYALAVPLDAPAGEYRVAIGLYRWQTGRRLSIQDVEGRRLPDDRVLLQPPIPVVPE